MADFSGVFNGLSDEQRARLAELTGLSFPSPGQNVTPVPPAPPAPPAVPDMSAFQKPSPPIDRNELNGTSVGSLDADVPTDIRVPLLKEAQTTPAVPRERVIGLPPPGFKTGISIGDFQFPSASDTTLGLAQSLQPSGAGSISRQEAQAELPPVPRPDAPPPAQLQPAPLDLNRQDVAMQQSPALSILDDYASAAQREKEALSTQAIKSAELETARSALIDAEVKRQAERVEEQRLLNERRQFDKNVALAKLEEAQKAYEKADINPGQWWDTRSDGQKFAAVVGVMLGSLGSALSKGPNAALDIINNHISNDIAAQRARLSKAGDVVSKRQNMLQILRDEFNDEDAAAIALENIKLQGVKLELDKQLADTNSQLKVAQGAEMVAKIDKQLAENTIKLATIIDENSRQNFLADLQAQKFAAQQQASREPQALTETARAIMDAFPGDTKRQNAALKELGQREGYNKETQVIINAARKLKEIKGRVGELIPGTNPSREWDQQVALITSTLQRGIKGAASDKDIERMLGLIPSKISTDTAVDRSIEALMMERAKAIPQTPLLNNFVDGRLNPGTSARTSQSSQDSSNDAMNGQSQQKKSEHSGSLRASDEDVKQKLIRSIPEANREIIASSISEAAKASDVPEDIMFALAKVESNFNPYAKNSKSTASGMFQQIDSTAKELGVTNRFDVKQASAGAGKHLKQLLNEFDGDEDLAIMAYFAGPSIVKNAVKAGRRNILVDDVPLDAATNKPGPDGRITYAERVERARNTNEYLKKVKGILEK